MFVLHPSMNTVWSDTASKFQSYLDLHYMSCVIRLKRQKIPSLGDKYLVEMI
jgi:hypothetical protein